MAIYHKTQQFSHKKQCYWPPLHPCHYTLRVTLDVFGGKFWPNLAKLDPMLVLWGSFIISEPLKSDSVPLKTFRTTFLKPRFNLKILLEMDICYRTVIVPDIYYRSTFAQVAAINGEVPWISFPYGCNLKRVREQ